MLKEKFIMVFIDRWIEVYVVRRKIAICISNWIMNALLCLSNWENWTEKMTTIETST